MLFGKILECRKETGNDSVREFQGHEVVRMIHGVEKERGKEKRPHGKGGKKKIAPSNITRKRQTPGSTIGILNEFCFVWF